MSKLKSADLEGLADRLTTALHGSGFDGEWKVRQLKNGQCVASIGYHCMDENGYYDGWFDIHVTFNPETLEPIRQTYSADTYHRRKYIEGEYYYDDAVGDAFDSIKTEVTK